LSEVSYRAKKEIQSKFCHEEKLPLNIDIINQYTWGVEAKPLLGLAKIVVPQPQMVRFRKVERSIERLKSQE